MKKSILFLSLCFLMFLSCSSSSQSQSGSSKSDTQTNDQSSSSNDKLKSVDKPLMRFTSQYIEGKKFDSNDYQGDRIIFAFFTFKHKNAAHMLQALQELKPFQSQYRLRIFAVSLDHGKEKEVQQFFKQNKIDFPILMDTSDAKLAKKLKIEDELSLRTLSNDHRLSFGLKKYVFADIPNGKNEFVKIMKQYLKIKSYHGMTPVLGIHPQAKNFKAKTIDGKAIELNKLKGKVVLLFFYSPTCPHCHREIAFLKSKIYPEYSKKGLEIIAVSVLEIQGRIKEFNDKLKMPWPIIEDAKREIRSLYSQSGSVPESFMIDQKGKVRYHSAGFGPTHPNRLIMQLRHLFGEPNPTDLLSKNHYNGAETCMVCHEAQYVQWQTTAHAHAWQTLEVKGEDTNPQCVGCHSLGFEDKKGYKSIVDKRTNKKVALAPEFLQNVSCENCHGVGGPHVSGPKTEPEMKKGCLECHTEKFSLHFDFGERVEKVNHSNADEILKLSAEQRLELLKSIGKEPATLFDQHVKYVGSNSCMKCHDSVHKNWSKSVHAHAFDTLKSVGKEKNSECLQCHTVGYGKEGGYHETQRDDLKGVGCESCHGPGEKHIVSQKKKDIRGLGDDCPFCVIEQICLSCHDSVNSPDFNIHKGLERIKNHGPESIKPKKDQGSKTVQSK